MKQIHKTSPDDSAMPNQQHDGCTKREKFAYGAMIGMLANPQGCMTSGSSRSFHPQTIAECAVNQADELIKALNDSSHEELK